MADTLTHHLSRSKAHEERVDHPLQYQAADKDRSLPAGSEDSLLRTTSAGNTSCRAYATTLLAGLWWCVPRPRPRLFYHLRNSPDALAFVNELGGSASLERTRNS